MNISTPIAVCAEEISNIGKENGILQKEKETLDSIKLSVKLFQNSIAHDKAEIEKQNDKLKYYSAVSAEEKASLENELKSVRNELSSLGLFEIKRRKALKEKESNLDRRVIKARIYLSTVDELAKLEDDLKKCSKRLPELISNRDALQTKLEAKEKDIMTRTEDAIKAIGITKQRVEAIAEAISCPSNLLPSALLNVLITNEKSSLIKRLNLDQQIKILRNRDIPLRFGGMEWNVMEIRKDRAFLILRGTVYDGIGFCDSNNCTWEKSYGREKLNGEFLERFTDKEKSLIIPNEKSFGDKFTILGKSEIDAYLDFDQCNAHSHWWISGGTYDKYDEEKPWRIYYWDSYYDVEYRSSFVNKWIDITYPKSRSDRDHPIGYRPVVWVKIKDDPTDAAWAKLWAKTETESISCKGKWKSTRNLVHAPTIFASDLRESFNRIYGGSSTSPRKPIDNFNPDGTPSGHGGRF